MLHYYWTPEASVVAPLQFDYSEQVLEAQVPINSDLGLALDAERAYSALVEIEAVETESNF